MYISLLKISSLHIFQDHPMLHKEQRRLVKRKILKFSPPFTFTVKFELLFLSLGIMF